MLDTRGGASVLAVFIWCLDMGDTSGGASAMAVFYWWTLVAKEVSLMSLNNDTTGGQSVTEYEYKILFGFQKSPNTECSILFGIDKI